MSVDEAGACFLVERVRDYAKWIAKERPALVQGALRFVLETALRTPAAADHAAEAFRSLCVHARKQLASAETFGAILAAVEPCFAAGRSLGTSTHLDGNWVWRDGSRASGVRQCRHIVKMHTLTAREAA